MGYEKTRYSPIKALITSIGIALLTACGGGDDAPGRGSVSTSGGANPLGGPPVARAPDEVAEDLGRRTRMGTVLAKPNPTADQILNWAEINYSQYFPSHSTTLTEGSWIYRSYMQTGVLLGIRGDDVYVTGGEFGGQLLNVGKISDYVKPAIAVKRSSYENKFIAGQMSGPINKPWPATKMIDSEEITAGIALADFFQEGALSVVGFSNTFNNPNGPATLAGKAYFFRLENGAWIDRSSLLLKDQTGCISPRKLLIADFNGDGKPDVFASCTGYDAPVNGRLPGEHPRFLLSQADGTYRNAPFDFNCYCHGAAAVDIRNDGHADIVVQDNAGEGVVYFVNNKDGTFSMDRSRVPTYEPGYMGSRARSIWTVEVLDVWGSGKYDLFLGGVDITIVDYCCSWTSRIYSNRGNDTWGHDAVIELPSLPGNSTDVYDMMVLNGKVYELRDGPSHFSGYNSMAIRSVDLGTLKSIPLYEHSGVFNDGYTTMNQWFVFDGVHLRNFYTYPDIAVTP